MSLLRQLRALFRRKTLEAEMAEEMRQHLERRTQEKIADGMSPAEARYAAQRTFGNVGSIQERVRDQRSWHSLEHVIKDVRHGVRMLARAPGFTFAAILSLAIGIGANTAMFSIVNGVLLRPLPYPDAERLVTLWSENRRLGLSQQTSGYANIADWQQAARTLDGVAVYDPASMIVMAAEARRTSGLFASPNLAEVLRVSPHLGRMFTADEAARREPVAVISHAAWQQRHGGVRDILGQRIVVDGRPTEIIGVMPAGFYFPDKQTEFWMPHALFPNWESARLARGIGPWRVLARLHPGATLDAAQTELSHVAVALEKNFSANAELGIHVVPLAEHVVGRELRNALLLLLAAVGAVLLIACSNVGNLLLARGLTRQREFALRLSLGAPRRRLVAQLLVENLVLCLVAAAMGAALAWLAVDAARKLAPGNIPRLADATIDPRMLAFALLLSLASACVFGLLPALQATRRDALAMLRNAARDSADAPRGRRLRSALVVVEFALAVVLFAGGAMLVRSLAQLLAVDPGFKIKNVLVLGTRLPADRAERDAIPFAAALLERATALPGVEVAAIGEEVLLGERGQRPLSAERSSGEIVSLRMPLAIDAVTPDYFLALGAPLRHGRFFTSADREGAPRVVIINEALARQLWPGEPAIGRRLRQGGPNSPQPWATVVGVVADQRRQGLDRPVIAQAFWSWPQQPSRSMILVVRTAIEPATLAASLRQVVRSIDATVPLEAGTTLRAQIDHGLAPRRFHTGVLTTFAAMALILAGVGIFGLMHYSVARRTQEIGVRTALGASAAQILRQILAEGLTLAGIGVSIGVAGAIALLHMLSALLYEVSPTDPVSLGTAAVGMIAIAALACFLPALRASRIDPMVALRAD